MSILNITCPICTETFRNSDDVYSTSCGHIYHFLCMNDWQTRNTSCAQCRQYNPTYHKLYLSFDESADNLEDLQEMEQKLKSSNERIIELQVQNSEAELNFMKLQEQYTASENAKNLLEMNIKQMKDSETNFMQLQGQYTESSELIRDLQCRITQLHMDNESKDQQLQSIISENASLKAAKNTNGKVMPDSILQQKIKILEQKLENITKELEREINASTQLSIEKMKLESMIKNSNTTTTTNMRANTPANQGQDQKKNQPGSNSSRRDNHKPISNSNQNRAAEPYNKCVIIKNLPYCLTDEPLEKIIVNVVSKCNMTISASDLKNIRFFDDTKKKIVFEFKNNYLKQKFLAKKCILKKDPMLEEVKIREFMHLHIFELYRYAKDNLKGKCFDCVFCSNNKIYGKSYKDVRDVVQIMNKQQVDQLLATKNIDKSSDATKESIDGARLD